jgi:hypothetical protein
MKTRFLVSLTLIASVACLMVRPLPAQALKTIDATNTSFGWQVLNDKPPVPALEIVAGPKAKTKALQLNFQFSEGIWVALVKNASISLDEGEGLHFYFHGSGAHVNFKIKLTDAGGTVFGYIVPSGSVVSEWKEVTIPRSGFSYLWGGQGAGSMNWASIAKLEFTLDTDQMAGLSYTLNKTKPGKLKIYNIEVVSTKGLKIEPGIAVAAPAPAASSGAAPYQSKLKESKDGFVTIHPMSHPDGWNTIVDQDGKCELASKNVQVGKKSVKALKVDFQFGSKGIWTAAVLGTKVDLSKMRFLRVMFKGEGGAHKLTIKISDSKQTVFGYPVKTPTNVNAWTNIIAAKDEMSYLYGGSGAPGMNWGEITKIEFTFDKKDEASNTGTLYFGPLQYK